MTDAVENWKDVPGFEGRYRVSDLGRVYSLLSGRCLRPGRMSGGHLSVALGRGNTKSVHVLVLTAFSRPPEEGELCRHLNGQHADNRFVNLAWGSRRENEQDKKHHNGGVARKLTIEAAKQIKAGLTGRTPHRTLAARFGVARSLISSIASGKCHGDV